MLRYRCSDVLSAHELDKYFLFQIPPGDICCNIDVEMSIVLVN